MLTNLDKYKADLDSLIKLGDTMSLDLAFGYMEEEGQLSGEDKKNFKKFKGGKGGRPFYLYIHLIFLI